MKSEKCKGKRYKFCVQMFNFNFYNLQFAFCTEYSLDIQNNLDGVQ
ncbi:MAG: hypothetical protein ABIK26_03175 [Candidatus Omnitrophota bacterium]|nr:hypothetical protein [Candidatus Omnitrophota bacterium]